jgi:hypothetical protein
MTTFYFIDARFELRYQPTPITTLHHVDSPLLSLVAVRTVESQEEKRLIISIFRRLTDAFPA